jgi:hypothetical protein
MCGRKEKKDWVFWVLVFVEKKSSSKSRFVFGCSVLGRLKF